MDGEIGRFAFKTYDVKGENQKSIFEGIQMFPARKGRQWYPTCGFKTIAIIYGAAQRSYRQTIAVLNFNRRQEVGGTPLNTLRDVVQAEGLKVLDFLTRKTESIFKNNGFNSQGTPEETCRIIKEIPDACYLKPEQLQPALNAVCEEMTRQGLSAEDIQTVCQTIVDNKVYEKTEQCVYIHIDDVGVKEQKQHRDKKNPAEESTVPSEDTANKEGIVNQESSTKDKRLTVQNTVARIEQSGNSAASRS